jgi:hypothetical protein
MDLASFGSRGCGRCRRWDSSPRGPHITVHPLRELAYVEHPVIDQVNQAPALPVVVDDPARMQRMLGILYGRVSDVLAKNAPNGLIPREAVTVVMPPWHDVHARTTTLDGVTTIKISLGLVHLLYGINRALAARATVQGGDAVSSPSVDLANELCACLDEASAPMLPLKRGSRLTDEQVKLAEMQTRWGEWFLLAHELAHAHAIDRAAIVTLPMFARFDRDHERAAREHAADFFAAWLLRHMASDQTRRAGSQYATEEAALQLQNIAYAGSELALHAIELLELYDPAARPTLHPTAGDRIIFLREGLTAGGGPMLLRDALQWGALLAANAPQAIAAATVNAEVAARELTALIDRASAASDTAWLDERDRVSTFLLGSRSGSMRLLLRLITQPPSNGPRQRIALVLAERYLPRTEPAYAPFWNAIDNGEGGWT